MKGFKTVAFGVLVALLSLLSNATPEWQAFVAAHIPVLGSITGVLVVVLRAITDSPIFKSGS